MYYFSIRKYNIVSLNRLILKSLFNKSVDSCLDNFYLKKKFDINSKNWD